MKKSNRHTLLLTLATNDTSLLIQNSGGLYNFPAGIDGELLLRLRIDDNFYGMLMSLHDRWFNPVDTTAKHYAMFNIPLSKEFAKNGGDIDLMLKWVPLLPLRT